MKGISLLLGSNLGDRYDTLQVAQVHIEDRGCKIINTSSVFQTKAWGLTDQPDFLNQVLEVETGMGAVELLRHILEIETKMGRQRSKKWASRIIDIDILYFGRHIIEKENLQVPHPEIRNRRFALAPMAEISPDFVHPVLQQTQSNLLLQCQDPLEATKYKKSRPRSGVGLFAFMKTLLS
jgi:2-amino-4-hydroxy-6-hydroxymethyldihydropteridine diphosphokinase